MQSEGEVAAKSRAGKRKEKSLKARHGNGNGNGDSWEPSDKTSRTILPAGT